MTIELGNRLAELRKEHGLSQEELADKLGVSRQAVSKWERGEASPDTDNLIELAKIYNISLDELLGLSAKEGGKEPKDDEGIGIHIHGGVHIKDEDGNEVHVDEHGVHVKDEDGSEVRVGGGEVHIVDENGEVRRRVHIHEKEHRVTALVGLLTTFGAIIAYILLGTLAGLWGQAWVLFLLIPIAPSVSEAIINKNLNMFAYPVFIVFLYFTLCMWVLPEAVGKYYWHPLWVMFLTIPVYYGVINFIHPNKD